jgi:hypothetical protein
LNGRKLTYEELQKLLGDRYSQQSEDLLAHSKDAHS